METGAPLILTHRRRKIANPISLETKGVLGGAACRVCKNTLPLDKHIKFHKGENCSQDVGSAVTDWSNLHALQRYKEPACSKPFITTFCSRCFLPFPLQTSTRVNSSPSSFGIGSAGTTYNSTCKLSGNNKPSTISMIY